jgi:hypothetical protein
LIDALKSITNTDQGMWYPKWALWWEANQNLPLRQWKLNGFADAGLQVADPVDQRFALELVEAIGRKSPEYLSRNAKILLSEAPHEMLNAWIKLAASSERRILRLGIVRYIGQSKQYIAFLQHLKNDLDPEI